jgi:hypothetical protein
LDDIIEIQEEEEIEEQELDEDEILTIPDELPEQLFLDEKLLDEFELDILSIFEDEVAEQGGDKLSLLERAKAALAESEKLETGEVSEDELIRIELRERVSAFISDNTEMALKLFRVLLHQDDEK